MVEPSLPQTSESSKGFFVSLRRPTGEAGIIPATVSTRGRAESVACGAFSLKASPPPPFLSRRRPAYLDINDRI